MATSQYQGILFPDRAESLPEFSGYKVFLDHWDGLGAELRRLYEGLALRRETRALAIFGEQGSGKTLFATKLADDIEHSRHALQKGQLASDPSNLWHRISGSTLLDYSLLEEATEKVSVHMIENNKDWVAKSTGWLSPQKDKHAILIADNAERAYFRQGLLDLSDADYVTMGETDAAMKLVAQNFVARCRSDLRGSLVVLLSNDQDFLMSFFYAVEKQHQGLISLENLPLPQGGDKETVIRVNTNRLNRISYWFCLDKAGPADKQKVRSMLMGPGTYPAAFAAVDGAIRAASPQRVGRPAKKNMLSLVVFAGQSGDFPSIVAEFGAPARTEFDCGWAVGNVYSVGWTSGTLNDQRACQLLESEWDLRLVLLGEPFIQALFSGDRRRNHCRKFLQDLEPVFGPGTRPETRAATRASCEASLTAWPNVDDVDLAPFWEKGQGRSSDYESILRELISDYNVTAQGFLSYRPDFTVSPFRPCAVTSAKSNHIDDINAAIRRDAHTFEFTAQRRPTIDTIRTYMRGKLENYVLVTQEQ